jgi:hypothetical protein
VNKRIIIVIAVISLAAGVCPAMAGSIGDFFKALGNSIAHPTRHPKPRPRDATTANKRSKSGDKTIPGDTPPPVPTPMPSPSPGVQPSVRVASAPADRRSSKRDLPYAIPIPNKPGFVTSPYAPKQGLVDVRGFPSGTEVIDPYSGKVFLTP